MPGKKVKSTMDLAAFLNPPLAIQRTLIIPPKKRRRKAYFVEWSAPNYRNAGHMTVLANTKVEAIKKVKTRLGKKVKKLHLHHFDDWRIKKR